MRCALRKNSPQRRSRFESLEMRAMLSADPLAGSADFFLDTPPTDSFDASDIANSQERLIVAFGRHGKSTRDKLSEDGSSRANDRAAIGQEDQLTPYLKGAAVLLRKALELVGEDEASDGRIRQIMFDTADKVFDHVTASMYKRVNLARAVQSIMTADDFGSTAEDAHDWGVLDGSRSISGMVSTLGDADYFTFTAARSGVVSLASTFSTAEGAVDAELQLVGGGSESGGVLSFDVVAGESYTVAISAEGEVGHYVLVARLAAYSAPPTAPESFTAVGISTDQIGLAWTDSQREDGYRIHLQTDAGSIVLGTLAGGSTTFSVSGLASGQQYWFAVEALNDLGSTFSVWTSGSTLVDPPTTPGAFTVTTAGLDQLDLSWTDSEREDGYRVYRWNGAAAELMATLSADSTLYSITGLSANTQYWFTIEAFNESGSAFAPWTAGRTSGAPVVAEPLMFEAVATSEIDLSWADAEGELGYRIYQWDGAGGALIGTTDADDTSFSVTGLAANTTYWFTLEAYNEAGSSFLAWISTTTLNEETSPLLSASSLDEGDSLASATIDSYEFSDSTDESHEVESTFSDGIDEVARNFAAHDTHHRQTRGHGHQHRDQLFAEQGSGGGLFDEQGRDDESTMVTNAWDFLV